MANMLLNLPDEALVCVFSFIEGKELISSVSVVCRRFRDIITSEWYWRRRFSVCCNGSEMVHIGPHVNEELQGIQRCCIDAEEVRLACNDKLEYMKTESLSAATGGIDCVKLLYPSMNRTDVILAAGSRDHIIYLWKKRSQDKSTRSMREYISSELVGHMGWVWCLASHTSNQGVLASGSWDQDIRLWDVAVGQTLRQLRKVHKAAVLSLTFLQPHQLLSGGFDKQLRVFDLQDNNPSGMYLGSHLKSVLSVASLAPLIYTAGEDKTVKLWDLRRPEVEVANVKCSSSVTSICLNHGILSAASGTSIRLFNTSNGQLTANTEFESGHATPLTSIYHNLGMVITGSKDHTACIHTMTTPHTCLKQFNHRADVTDIHYSKGLFAFGSSDRTVTLWLPKTVDK